MLLYKKLLLMTFGTTLVFVFVKASRPDLGSLQPPVQRVSGFFPRAKANHFYLVPRSRMNGAILLLPLYTFMLLSITFNCS